MRMRPNHRDGHAEHYPALNSLVTVAVVCEAKGPCHGTNFDVA